MNQKLQDSIDINIDRREHSFFEEIRELTGKEIELLGHVGGGGCTFYVTSCGKADGDEDCRD
jgi:hypothetical protein